MLRFCELHLATTKITIFSNLICRFIVVWYYFGIFLEPSKINLMLLYHLRQRDKFWHALPFATCKESSITTTIYFLMASKNIRVDNRLKITYMSNLNLFSIVAGAKCYWQNLNISMGFGGAHSLVSGYFCPPGGRVSPF